MSFLIAAPEFVAAAASDLANIGSAITQANATALVPTSGVLAAGRLFTSSSCNS
jgi:PE family